MKQLVLISFILLVLNSCNNQNSDKKNHDDIICSRAEYCIPIQNTNPEELPILENFASKKFVKSIIEKVLSGELKGYDYFNEAPKELSIEEIREAMNATTDTIQYYTETGELAKKIIKGEINYNEYKELIFIEKWFYNKKTHDFVKEVVAFGPVRHYFKVEDINQQEIFKRIPFIIYNKDINNSNQ